MFLGDDTEPMDTHKVTRQRARNDATSNARTKWQAAAAERQISENGYYRQTVSPKAMKAAAEADIAAYRAYRMADLDAILGDKGLDGI